MAFDLVAAGGYGSGTLGDVTDPVGNICTTGIVFRFHNGDCYIEDKEVGLYGDFAEGMDVLIHVAGMSDISLQEDVEAGLGRWAVVSISSVDTENNIISLSAYDVEAFDAICNASGLNLRVGVTTIPDFRNLTLNTGCYLTPRFGFPLAFKCSGTLTLNGGHIDLRNKGTASDSRPLLLQEEDGTLDTDKYSGWENSDTYRHLPLNCGDGAAFIIAKKLNVANIASRIGNPATHGIRYCRGASNSPDVLSGNISGVTNVGGSTILLVAGTITNFNAAIIAKYRDSTLEAGQGLARCYIASNTKLRNDEGLYAYDCISNPSRLETMNVKSFGDGSDGASSLTSQINNYAKVTAIASTRTVLTITGKTTAGAIPFALGKLVMYHAKQNAASPMDKTGRFFLAKIIGISGDDITIDTPVPSDFPDNFTDYRNQLITIPQYSSYTLSGENSATLAFDGDKGGIFAIAVNGTCDLSGGKINVIRKGGGRQYASEGLKTIGNAQDCDKLPIGQGHGSVFILANRLVMDSATRIGATYSGAINNTVVGENRFFGGTALSHRSSRGGGYNGYPTVHVDSQPSSGGGGGGGVSGDNEAGSGINGGYGGNGGHWYDTTNPKYGMQGAHIMIIANTITGFNQAAISTGGSGGNNFNGATQLTDDTTQNNFGSAGYGGAGHWNSGLGNYHSSGGYNGGGASYDSPGGSSGWAFIYCNNAVNQDTTDTVYL